MKPADAPLPAGLVEPETYVTPAGLIAFTEGPACDREGNVFFSDIVNNRILKRDPSGEVSVFRADSGRTNGNIFDAEGRLLSCEGAEFGPGGRRQITRTEMTSGEVEVLTDRYEGQRYNSPNDICVDTRGNIYFTDPRYGDQTDREMEVEAVYRIATDGSVRRILTDEVEKPNGIVIAPDDVTLYVVDANPEVGGNRKIWAFDVDGEGTCTNRNCIYDFAPGRGGDGMRLDVEGNLWIAGGINADRSNAGETLDTPAGVYVVSPAGELLGRIPIPEDLVTNLTFGPPDRKTLYVTAGKCLYRIPIGVSGYVL